MDQITAQDRLDAALTPVAPAAAMLTTAQHLEPGDRIVQGRGSRYKGPDFTVAAVESVPMLRTRYGTLPVRPCVNITGTKGERLTVVSLDAAYYVERGAVQ